MGLSRFLQLLYLKIINNVLYIIVLKSFPKRASEDQNFGKMAITCTFIGLKPHFYD